MKRVDSVERRGSCKVAVFRALQLGDLLCAVPALRALRAGMPGARVDLVGLPWARGFAERFSAYVDGFIEFPGFPGLPECEPDIPALPAFLSAMQAREYDLVLQLHGDGRLTNSIVALFDAQAYAGTALPDAYRPHPGTFIAPVHGRHEIQRNLAVVRALGIPAEDEELELPITPPERAECAAFMQEHGLVRGGYACVHPGGRSPWRRWPAEQFAAVVEGLTERGLRVVVTGTEEERDVAGAVVGPFGTAVTAAGRTSLGGVAALIEGSRLLICNDTGVSHVACAVGTPSVVLVTNSEPSRWAPLDRQMHRVLVSDGIDYPSPQMVLDQADALLRETGARSAMPSALAGACL